MKTLFECLGYKANDVFVVVDDRNHSFIKSGEIVMLEDDDGSDMPFFINGENENDVAAIKLTRLKKIGRL